MNRPNIVYIHSHDTGRFIQPYGHAVPTPHLQQLAEQGVLFRQAFSAAPTCSPSRAALLTGMWPHSAGMLGLAHLGFRLSNYEQHIANTLRLTGYQTVLAGIQHVAPWSDPTLPGFDLLLETVGKEQRTGGAPSVASAAANFIRQEHHKPFFIDIGFFETHRPFPETDAEDDSRYILPPTPLPDTPEVRADMAAYKTSVRRMDQGVGIVLDAIEQAGLSEQTLIIYTTDHGLAFPAMKCNLTDSGISVSLIMRGPDGLNGGKVIDSMVSHIDVFPTICEMLSIPLPEWLQGTSLLPLLDGQVEQIREQIFAEVSYHAAYEPQRSVRTQRWKYIRRYGNTSELIQANCDASPSRSYWLEQGWQEQSRAQEMLYDLVFDPNERRNLVAEPAYASTLAEMRHRLDSWMQETNDPLLHGDIPLPEGAMAHAPGV